MPVAHTTVIPLGLADHQPSTTVDLGLDRLGRATLKNSSDWKALILTRKTTTCWNIAVTNKRQKNKAILRGFSLPSRLKAQKMLQGWKRLAMYTSANRIV